MISRLGSVLSSSVIASALVPPETRARLLRRLGVQVGRDARIMQGVDLRPGDIRVGDRCFINARCSLAPGSASIVLEDDVVVATGVVLAAESHELGGPDRRATGSVSAPIRVGAGSWIGAGAIVLPGVTIGPGCVVGAGAVVTQDLKPNAVYAGVPARWLRDLDDQFAPTVIP